MWIHSRSRERLIRNRPRHLRQLQARCGNIFFVASVGLPCNASRFQSPAGKPEKKANRQFLSELRTMKKQIKKPVRLGIRDIQRVISEKEGKPRITSVPTPSAQTLGLCVAGPGDGQLAKQIASSMATLARSNPPVHLLAMIMLESGCRVSEALQIRSTDVTLQGRIMISAKKGGHDRIVKINVPGINWAMIKSGPAMIFQGISRFHVYREFKRSGLSFVMEGRSKASVTHLFRHYVAHDLYTADKSNETIKTGLGHKSEGSAEYYKPTE